MAKTGRMLQAHGTPVTDVYFPNGGVFSVTNQMCDGALVGGRHRGHRGHARDPRVPWGSLGRRPHIPASTGWSPPVDDARRFVKESAAPGPFATCWRCTPRANLLQIMQGTVCNALHGVQRPTGTLVMGTLQDGGLISIRYGRIRVLKRKRLEAAACECYDVIRARCRRLGL